MYMEEMEGRCGVFILCILFMIDWFEANGEMCSSLCVVGSVIRVIKNLFNAVFGGNLKKN